MKKKIMLLVLILVPSLTVLSQVRNYSESSPWFVTISGGINLFDGDISKTTTSLLPEATPSKMFGAGVGYVMSPIYSISLDYSYFLAIAKTKNWDIKTKVNTGVLNFSVNLLNLIFPDRDEDSKFETYASLGFGFTYYSYNEGYNVGNSYGVACLAPISVSEIYNISERLGMGLKVSFLSFSADNLEGIEHLNYKGVSNDRAEIVSLFAKIHL